jgi:hypothetical protein
MSTVFNASFYLTNNPDVVLAISQGHFSSAAQHFDAFGGRELRNPNSSFDSSYYSVQNPDVLSAVSSGVFANAFAHFQSFGISENRAPTSVFANFNATTYLESNVDVAAAVTSGAISSALDHFMAFGINESRAGSGVNNAQVNPGTTFTLTNSANQVTGGSDNFTGSSNDDTFLATADAALDNGDVVDGGAGTDTLTARYLLADNKTVGASITNVENINVDIDDGDTANGETLTFTAAFTGLSEVNVKDANSTNTAEDTVSITSLAAGVDIGVENGDGEFNVTAALATSTGTADAMTVNLDTANVDTVTVANVETITLNGELGNSTIATLTTTAATTVNVTGSGDVTVSNVDDATTTINASAATGEVDVLGIGAVTSVVTGGSDNDTFGFGANLTSADTVDGGAGTGDRIIVSGSETAALSNVTNVEQLEIEVADIGGGATVTLSGTVSSGINTFVLDANTATDNDDAEVAITNLDDGDTIRILDGGADTTSLADGVALTTAFTSNTSSNSLTLQFDGIGAVSADTSNDTGLANVEVDEVETLTIVSNNNSTGATTTNQIEQLDVATATSIVFSGAADFETNDNTATNFDAYDGVANTTSLTSIDASAMTGELVLSGVDASAITITAAQTDTEISMAGLNASDQIIGGAGTSDILLGQAVTGLTATTGVLNIQNVETVNLEATGANTIDASLLSGVNILGVSGATPGTQTITNVAAGLIIAAGDVREEFDNAAEMDITLADSTGTSDSLTINLDNRGGADTDVAFDISGVENITFDVQDADTGNNMAVTITEMEASSLTVVDGFAGAVLAMGTLDAATSTLDLTGYNGEVSFTGSAVTGAMTVTASSSAAADDFTLSGQNDTATIGNTGAVDVDVDGAGGTDVLNLTLGTGFINTANIDGFETLNITVTAGNDVTIGANGTAATDENAISEATTVTLLGGNSLSTFQIGDGGAATEAAAITGTALTTFNASAFAGNIDIEFDADILTGTMNIDGGILTTDTVRGDFDTASTDVQFDFAGVERFFANLNSGDTAANEQYTFDLQSTTGLTRMDFASSNGENTLLDIDGYSSDVNIRLGATVNNAVQAYDSSSEIDVNLSSASGTSDVVNMTLTDTDAAVGTIDIDAAGVETLNLAVTNNAESHQIDLAGVAATSGSNVGVVITGGNSATQTLTIANVASTTNVIDATGLGHTLVITDRGASAITITGGDAADTLRMENTADVMTGGSGDDNLVIVQNALLGGFSINLNASGDQVTTYNGSANAAVQSGFKDVDLRSSTGSGAADITGASTGSTIVGTANIDQITLENATTNVDDIVIQANGTAASYGDQITNFVVGASNDVLQLDLSDLNTAGRAGDATTDLDLVDISVSGGAAAASLTAGNGVTQTVTGDNVALIAGRDVILLDAGATQFASADAAVDALESAGSFSITHKDTAAAGDAIVFAYEGTDSNVHIALAKFIAADDNQAIAAVIANANLDGIDLVTLVGVTDVTTLDATNIAFIA